MNVLVVEDDTGIGAMVRRGLEGANFQVEWAIDGATGLRLAGETAYSVIILDVMLPKLDGWRVCEELRAQRNRTPILMLTARDAVEYRVRGLEIGADDYLPKPFDFTELLARVRALLRRDKIHRTRMIRIGDLEIDTLGGAYLTNRVLRRVHLTTQAARDMSGGDFSTRLPVTGSDEFSELADTFNGLLDRLHGAFEQQQLILEQQRRFTADASHELKTPLTVIKGTASLALHNQPTPENYRAALQEIDRAADTMSHLVQDLLLLARSDGGQLGKDPIELLVRDLLDSTVAGIARDRTLITVDIADETLAVMGNERELVRLFCNILDNAVRHTLSEETILITAQAEGSTAVIRVQDTGSGIAPEHLPHLGERFYRVDSARARVDGGTGLGLSICKGIIDAHGGTLSIESTLDVGTTVMIRLPRVQ